MSFLLIPLLRCALGITLACLTLPVGLAGAAEASRPIGMPGNLEPAAVESFVVPLTDAEVRSLLIQRLKAETLSKEAMPGSTGMDVSMLLSGVDTTIAGLNDRLRGVTMALDGLPAALAQIGHGLAGNHGANVWWLAPLALAAMLLLGYGAERLVGRYLGSVASHMLGGELAHLSTRLSAAGFGFLLALFRLAAFTIVAYGVSLLFMPAPDPLRKLLGAVVLLIFATRLIGAVADALLAPGAPALRVLSYDDATANRRRRRAVVLGGLVSFAGISHGMLRLLGLPADLLRLYVIGFGLVIGVFVIGGLIAEQHRRSAALPGGWQRLRARLAHSLLIGFLVLSFLAWSVNVLLERGNAAAGIALAVVIVLLVAPAARLVQALLHRMEGVAPAEAVAPAAAQPARRRSQALARFIAAGLRLLAALTVLALFADAGGMRFLAWLDSETGSRILHAAFQIALTLLLAAVGWHMLTSWIDRQLSAGESGEGGSVGSRAQTLLPLFRNFLWIGLVALVGMIVLSAVGVDIGPLLAGAGVVGLAIGFGAQTLVRDIVSGVFFLVDDAFRIGEYIEMGNIRGEVEKISIRSLTLRHHRGAVHTVPFGELKSITNYNRDWVIYKFSIGVTYDTDINRVKKIIKDIGAEMEADPTMSRYLLEPLKSQGVTNFADSSMTVRVKFKSKPREQFTLRRFAMQRIKEEFDKAGIEFAFPHVVVKAQGEVHPEAMAAAAAALQGKPAAHGGAATG